MFDSSSKVVCVIALHERFAVSIETIRLLNSQTHPITVVAVGGKKEKNLIAKHVDCHFVLHKNKPLGEKWQAGINYARKLNPDAVMICGSDTWLTTNWVERMLPHLNDENCDVIGKNIFHTCIVLKGHPIEIMKKTYIPSKSQYPAGSGRIMSKNILDKIDWNLFPKNRDKGLDTHCYRRIVDIGKGKYKVYNEDSSVNSLGIKSYWDTITSYTAIKVAKSLDELSFDFSAETWIDENFANGSKTLRKVSELAQSEVGASMVKKAHAEHIFRKNKNKKQVK